MSGTKACRPVVASLRADGAIPSQRQRLPSTDADHVERSLARAGRHCPILIHPLIVVRGLRSWHDGLHETGCREAHRASASIFVRVEALRVLRAHEREVRTKGVTALAMFDPTARGEASDVDCAGMGQPPLRLSQATRGNARSLGQRLNEYGVLGLSRI